MTTSATASRTPRVPAPDVSARSRLAHSWRDAVAVGVFGTLLTFALSWRPSLWFDEAATVSSIMRTWSQLGDMLTSVDAVHGLYYAAMKIWLDTVGYSPLTLRFPSALMVGAAAALIVVLVRLYATRRVALLAGIVFCLLPRVTWMGTEGRSYALTATLAVILTLVFLMAWRRGAAERGIRAGWWALYGLVAVLSTVVFIYLAFLVAAHGVTALWAYLAHRRRGDTSAGDTATTRQPATDHRANLSSLLGWLIAAGSAAALLMPFALMVVRQAGQVSWIAPIGTGTWNAVLVTQWFYLNPTFAAIAWALLVVGIVVLIGAERRSRWAADQPGVEPASSSRMPSLLAVVLPWLVVPTLGVIVASLVVSPLYSPRYLSYAAPAAAILIGVTVAAIGRRWIIAAVLVLLAAFAAPEYLGQREPEAKQNSSWAEVADFIADERAADPNTPEAIIYGPVRQHPAATTRVIEYSYPDAFAGLIDVKLRTPAAETGHLWETRYPLAEVEDRFDGVDIVWLVTSDKQDWRPSVTEKLAALGYSVDDEWAFTGVNVLRYVR